MRRWNKRRFCSRHIRRFLMTARLASMPTAMVLVLIGGMNATLMTDVSSKGRASTSPQVPVVVDLSTSANHISILGALSNDHLSGNAAPVALPDLRRALAGGDFNRDGLPDLAIGAPQADVVADGSLRPDAGSVYIVFGGQGFLTPSIVDTNALAPNQPNLRILGATAGDQFGFALGAGDVNGDGTDDLVIGAPGADFPAAGDLARPDVGAAYVILGTPTLGGQTIDLAVPNHADVIIYGVRTGDSFGSAVAVGNMGGLSSQPLREQAIKDILIGAPESKGPSPVRAPRDRGGAAYLFIGGSSLGRVDGASRVIDLARTNANLTVYGPSGALLGNALAIGDVNGNGVGDLLIGAPLMDRPGRGLPFVSAAADAGAVVIFFSGTSLVPLSGTRTIDLTVSSAPLVVYGADAEDHLGASVAAADVTGDGLGDILIGAPDADGGTNSRPGAGEAYVIAGGSRLTTRGRMDIALRDASLTIIGAQALDRLGLALAAGPLSAVGSTDAIADLVVAAPHADQNKGVVYAFRGGPDFLLTATRDLSLGGDDLRVLARAPGDELGWAVMVTDFNADAQGNLVIGAPGASIDIPGQIPRLQAGRVYGLLP